MGKSGQKLAIGNMQNWSNKNEQRWPECRCQSLNVLISRRRSFFGIQMLNSRILFECHIAQFGTSQARHLGERQQEYELALRLESLPPQLMFRFPLKWFAVWWSRWSGGWFFTPPLGRSSFPQPPERSGSKTGKSRQIRRGRKQNSLWTLGHLN